MAIPPRIDLVRNPGDANHRSAVSDVIGSADRVSIAVAFLKTAGLARISRLLETRLGAGATVEVFAGSDFFHTDPKALETLLDLSERHDGMSAFLARADTRSTFHPKIYLGVDAGEARALIGSANLTGGALGANEEVSLRCTLDPADPLVAKLRGTFDEYASSGRCDVLDAVLLDQYRRGHRIAQDARKRAERAIAAADGAIFDLKTLATLHAEFSGDAVQTAALQERRINLAKARSVQRRIAAMAKPGKPSKAEVADLTELFRDLVTRGDGHPHLWHSGDIHRRGQAALGQPRETIALFALGQTASRLPPEEGYARLRGPAADIAGVGINMVTEILCTFAPTRYAVFNGNTSEALRHIGADAPRSIALFSPQTYARVCGIVEAVRRRIGARDLSETDGFLNWIYDRKVR